MITSKRLKNLSVQTVLIILALAAVSVIAKKLFFRLDVTQDRIYTLSSGSRAITSKLQNPINIKYYFSQSRKDVPPMLKTYGTRVEEVLREYVAASAGKITLDVIDPKPDSDEEQWAHNYGLTGVPINTSESFFMGAVFITGDREEVIPYIDPRKEEFLEYDLSEMLVKLNNKNRPVVGILSPLPIKPPPSSHGYGEEGEKWALATALENLYDVRTQPVNSTEIPKDISVLLVIHPKEISESTEYAIDQFVMRGGRLIVAVDPFSRVDHALNANNPAMGMGRRVQMFSSTLPKLFGAWGINFTSKEMVGDTDTASQINTGMEDLTYPYFLTLSDANLAKTSKISGQLKQIVYAEGGALDLKEGSSYKFEPILTTGANSGLQNSDMAVFMDPTSLAGQFKSDSKKRTLAGLLSGKFKTAFASGPPAAGNTGTNLSPQIKEASGENFIFIVGDVDFLYDSNAVDKMRLGGQVILRPRNDNLNLVLNAIEFLGGNQDLISIRSSGKIARPFVKLQQIQQVAQSRWKHDEEQLSQELAGLQKKLTTMQATRTDSNRATLTAQQAEEIKKFRDQEHEISKRLRNVRKNLREDIESLGHVLLALNLIFVPLVVCGFGIYVFYSREKRAKEERNHG